MASRRILRSIPFSYKLGSIVFLLTCAFLVSSCGTSNRTAKGSKNTSGQRSAKQKISKKKFSQILRNNRSDLDDAFASQMSPIPETFQNDSSGHSNANPDQGYRVQILSTRNVQRADSVANHFGFWAESAMVKYVPETHIIFRQPYYKIRVGDFHSHKRALKLNRLLKKRYPGAWVVHDNVNPDLVPADTTKIELKKGY